MQEARDEVAFLHAKHAKVAPRPVMMVEEIPPLYPVAGYLTRAKPAKTISSKDKAGIFQKAVANALAGSTPLQPQGPAHPLCASSSQLKQDGAIKAFCSSAKTKGLRVAYTVCGGVYDKMIVETAATAKRIGLSGFFVVCLDKECVDIACANGIFAFEYAAVSKAKVAEGESLEKNGGDLVHRPT
jgi:hypothetical protein